MFRFAQLEWPTWLLLVAVCGVVAGSLANRLIDRLPVDQPLWFRLSCDVCSRRWGWVTSLPLIGLLFPSPRCSRCRAEARPTVHFVAAVTPLLWVLLGLRHGASSRALVLMVVVTVLITLSTIDFHHFLLPDALTVPGILAGVAATAVPGWPIDLVDSTVSAAVGYFAMMALATVARHYYGEEAIGQGDWKLVAMLGAFFGGARLLLIVLLANAIGAVIGLWLIARRGEAGRQKLPLGTFLGGVSTLLALL